MSLNIADIPLKSAALYPSAPAIILGDTVINYDSLSVQIRACASVLHAQGIKRGDKVAIILPNVPQFTITYFAIQTLGAVVVPLNVLFVKDEIEYHLEDSDAKALIAWESFLAQAYEAFNDSQCELLFTCTAEGSSTHIPENVIDLNAALQSAVKNNDYSQIDSVPTQADDTAVILYTSGTTGRPKGAELTHFGLYDNARYVSERLTRTEPVLLTCFSEGDIALACLPLFHSFGQTVIQNAFLLNGAAFVLLPRFTPEDASKLIAQHKITFFAGVPTMYSALINHPDVDPTQLRSLKYAVSGGAALPMDILQRFQELYQIPILEGYGLSETSPVCCFNNLLRPTKPGTVGPAIDVCRVKIVDEDGQSLPPGERGEIAIRGTNVMKGYYKRPDATNDVLINGWFHTGDIGILDEDHYLSIVDRKKEMIIRGGYNIYPREIEEVLYRHEAILEAAVIGIPDETHGEQVLAVCVVNKDYSLDHESLESYCREHLAAYKVPRISKFLTNLPKSATGKILKRVIRDQLLEEFTV